MRHREGRGSSNVFDITSAMIPGVDFTVSEPWQILSYKTGQDSPPRWDFINRTEKQLEKYGNRLATFMVLLKKATTAGHTIFPGYKITIELEEGDAVLWTNMQANGEKSIAAFHGDCAVGAGVKVTASLRIRAKGQLLAMSTMFGFFNVGLLALPRLHLPMNTCHAGEGF
ncbi:hypothetical protein TELCIR_02705 [Teladorsagia circumcincta]|uniref:Prolyl 4-hydroxylase alpha subunit Fe(2+) 2OG dioxygenase domain-containing protein n=1 Tax=Teladorsagia circumcincta TaxID=45464 RepID=A0A2G9UYF7_TELCI|nr:hypothetical protein TELCIR_02705 [Teladorsagia circumcincta]